MAKSCKPEHSDEAEDRKLITKMVKPAALKRVGAAPKKKKRAKGKKKD